MVSQVSDLVGASTLRLAVSVGALELLFVLVLVGVNQFFNVAATLSMAASGYAERPRTFVTWQIVGGLFGLGINLSFAGLVRYWSVGFANAVGIGLAFLSTQVIAAHFVYRERFAWPQWLGTALVLVGVLLIAVGPR